MGFFGKKKCPKCDSVNLNKVKQGLFSQAGRASVALLFFPFSLLFKEQKPLNVCRDCGFSWEDR